MTVSPPSPIELDARILVECSRDTGRFPGDERERVDENLARLFESLVDLVELVLAPFVRRGPEPGVSEQVTRGVWQAAQWAMPSAR